MNNDLLLQISSDAVVLISIFWMILYSRRRGRKASGNLRAIAEQLGLEFEAQKGTFVNVIARARIVGALRGRAVEVFTDTINQVGSSKMSWATVSARPTRDTGLTFTLERRNRFSKIVEEIGGWHGLTTGDAAFDAAWFAQSNSADFFTAALLPELREKLLAMYAAGLRGRFELKDYLVKYSEVGSLSGNDKLWAHIPALLDIVCDLADIAEVAPDGGRPADGA